MLVSINQVWNRLVKSSDKTKQFLGILKWQALVASSQDEVYTVK